MLCICSLFLKYRKLSRIFLENLNNSILTVFVPLTTYQLIWVANRPCLHLMATVYIHQFKKVVELWHIEIDCHFFIIVNKIFTQIKNSDKGLLFIYFNNFGYSNLCFIIIIIIISVFCPRAGLSLQTQATKAAVLPKGRSSTANRNQGCSLLGMNRCTSFLLLSAHQSLFSIWTILKRSSGGEEREFG